MSGICTHGISLDSPCVRCSMMGPAGGWSSPKVMLKPDLEGGKSYLSQVAAKYVNEKPPPEVNHHRKGTMSLCIDPDKMLGAEDQRLDSVDCPRCEALWERLRNVNDCMEKAAHNERSRIRALILKHYANDWTANELLKEVGE